MTGRPEDTNMNRYVECAACGMISPLSTSACPCGAEGRPAPWPREYATRTFVGAFVEDMADEPGREYVTAALYNALCLLMEQIMGELIAAKMREPGTAAMAFANCWGNIETMIQLFDTMSDTPFDKLMQGKNTGSFMRDLIYLTRLRRSLAARELSAPDEGGNETKSLLERLKKDSLPCMALLYNDVRRQTHGVPCDTTPAASVLVVDDEDEVRLRLVKFFERRGIRTYGAGTGAEAISLYQQYRPAYVFLDVMLPDTDGLKVLDAIRRHDAAAQVYFLTGVDGASFVKEAQQHGACGHFSKPVQLGELLKVIKELK